MSGREFTGSDRAYPAVSWPSSKATAGRVAAWVRSMRPRSSGEGFIGRRHLKLAEPAAEGDEARLSQRLVNLDAADLGGERTRQGSEIRGVPCRGRLDRSSTCVRRRYRDLMAVGVGDMVSPSCNERIPISVNYAVSDT